MRILLIEDEADVAELVRDILEPEGFTIDEARDGRTAIEMTSSNEYDAIILDINLPDISGTELMGKLRELAGPVPVLVLSGRATVEDRVKGLNLGADDYLVKPFAGDELAARLRALLRRPRQTGPASVLKVGEYELDRLERTVKRGERQIEMTPKEFALLEFLMMNAGRPVSRAEMLEHLWKGELDEGSTQVDVYVYYVRRKLEDPEGNFLQTVRGVGYQVG